MVNKIEIPIEILEQWDKQLLPDFDIYFFPLNHETLIQELSPNTLVLPKDDFYNNNILYTMDVINSYQMWQIENSKLNYVCISHPNAITSINKDTRDKIFRVQREVNNGLIFEWDKIKQFLDESSLNNLYPILEPFIFEENMKHWISIQKSLWNRLNREVRYGFLINFAKAFVDDVSIDEQILQKNIVKYPHIAPYFNAFSGISGANCFAATVAAIAGEDAETDWIISNWVLEDTLLLALKSNKYERIPFIEGELEPGDVVVWKNDKNIVHHACFHLGDGYFFNKHGQTFFNPWQVLKWGNLTETWGKEQIDIYRKNF